MVDAKLRPWLLEVNVAPSLSSSSPYDKQVKTMLLCDTLHLVGFQPFDRKRVDDERKKENKSRLLGLGYDPKKPGLRCAEDVSSLSPTKERSAQSDPTSPLKPGARDTIFGSSTSIIG